ncbi:MAG: hypothetical protein NTW94_02125 [Legionellales bacterium]|nr:hypothetical protein [Legionellales bacterium]
MPKNVADMIKQMKWSFLGRGSYNETYLSKLKQDIEGYECQWVLKLPKIKKYYHKEALSRKKRAIRKWRQLNPRLPSWEGSKGWISPYLGNTPANDKEIADKLLDIYQREQIIVLDACTKNNFLRHEGETVCVDVDLALHCDSPDSEAFWNDGMSEAMEAYWNESSVDYPLTVNIVRSLSYFDSLPAASKSKYLVYLSLKLLDYLRLLQVNQYILTERIMDLLCDIISRKLRLPDDVVLSLVNVSSPVIIACRTPDSSPLNSSHGFFAPRPMRHYVGVILDDLEDCEERHDKVERRPEMYISPSSCE